MTTKDLSQPNNQPTKRPLVWAFVLHWQGSSYTEACLQSLLEVNYPGLQILLVDNGSPDQSGSMIFDKFSHAQNISLLKTGENLGFAGGCNAGINYCLNKSADWIWLLNNDTKVDSNCLQVLIQAAENNPHAGALGAQVYRKEGNEMIKASAPGEIDFVRAKTYLRTSRGMAMPCPPGAPASRRHLPTNCAHPIPCAWLEGSNLLLKSEAIRQVKGFNEDYFLYFEDADICLRLQEKNWKCLFIPEAKIEHTGGASMQGERKYWRAYYHTRNRMLFFFSHTPMWKRLPQIISIGGHLLRHALTLPFRGVDGQKKLKAEMLGLRDYLFKRLGKAKCLDWCS